MHRTAIIARFALAATALTARLWAVVRGAAFWTAAVLPLTYPPLLLVRPVTPGDLWLLATLVPLNVLALVVGHGHALSPTESLDGRR